MHIHANTVSETSQAHCPTASKSRDVQSAQKKRERERVPPDNASSVLQSNAAVSLFYFPSYYNEQDASLFSAPQAFYRSTGSLYGCFSALYSRLWSFSILYGHLHHVVYLSILPVVTFLSVLGRLCHTRSVFTLISEASMCFKLHVDAHLVRISNFTHT